MDIVDYLTEKPKTLFLVDSLGAMLTAFFLFVVLRNFNEYFGMPLSILTYLSVIAVVFWVYSTSCFFMLKDNFAPFIIIISSANLLYCILTIWLIMVYYPILTNMGILYFLVEILLVCGLVYLEIKVAVEVRKNRLA